VKKRTFVGPVVIAIASGAFPLMSCTSNTDASAETKIQPAASQGSHEIDVKPWGPTPEMMDAAIARLATNPSVQPFSSTRTRLLSFKLSNSEKVAGESQPPDGFLATYFDYTNNRAYVVRGRFDSDAVAVEPTSTQPLPNREEFAEAVKILSNDPVLGPGLRDKKMKAYRPMPPLDNVNLPIEKTERTITVGLLPAGGSGRPEIVGVNMIRQTTVRYEGGAPSQARIAGEMCGPPEAPQQTTPGAHPSYQLTIKRDGVELWSFRVTRPSESSGDPDQGSGIDLTNVRYRGKRVLGQAHVPVLNVLYKDNGCGPYRDWQKDENEFHAVGRDLAGGFRLCTSKPTTMVDSGSDLGNFEGVAIWDTGNEVILVTELEAGWYRYAMKWSFRDDGVIKPRFGFSAVENPCVCIAHDHHVYWRFDFDVVAANRNSVCVKSSPSPTCAPITKEATLASIGSHLEVRNAAGAGAYRLTAGPNDGAPDAYSKGTAWVLADTPNEVHDRRSECKESPYYCTDIQINKFVNGQSTSDKDVVVWYRASFKHGAGDIAPPGLQATDDGPDLAGPGSHIVGPQLRPINW
jgi:hypothetical protein